MVLYSAGSGVFALGASANGVGLGSGDIEYVLPTGSATDTTVGSGGIENVYAGATDSGSTVNSRGSAYVSGTASGDTVSSGGWEVVYSGGLAAATQVASGGTLVLSGGAASGITVSSGSDGVFTGGTTTSSTIEFEAIEQVNHGGTTSDSQITFYGDEEILGGAAISATLDAGYEYVYSGGTATGTVVDNGSELEVFSGATFGTVVSSGGQEYLNGANTAATSASGTIVTGSGATQVVKGGTATGTVVSSGGEQYLAGGTAVGMVLSSGGTVDLIDGTVDGGILFAGTDTLLQIDGTTMPTATISRFWTSMTIDLTNEAYSSSGSATPTAGDRLEITGIGTGASPPALYLQLDADYTGVDFVLSPDGGVGTDITISSTSGGPPCYLAGTRIRTDRGEVAVEALRIGDRLVITDGGTLPLRWIGTRGLITRLLPAHRRAEILPVRIAAGALAEGIPARDLFVSPEHLLCLDGVLIPSRALVNASSIVQVESFDAVAYFHLELPRHAVIFAEGAPAESFLDTGNRNMFANVLSWLELGCDEADSPRTPCLPIVTGGRALAAVRARLARRAAALAAGSGAPAAQRRRSRPRRGEGTARAGRP